MNETPLAKGNRYFREQKYDKAVKEYTKAISQHESFYGYVNLAMAYEKLGQHADAAAAYRKSLEIKNNSKKAKAFLQEIEEKKRKEEKQAEKKKNEPLHPVEMIRRAIPKDVSKLKQEYYDKGLDKVADTFCLVRIIGNDLYPRHKKGQTRENVRFILENEKDFPDCTKLWIVNRIFDANERDHVVQMLEEFRQEYVEIPFVEDEYRTIPLDTDLKPSLLSKEYFELGPRQKDRYMAMMYRKKNNYVMNNNGARNRALIEGKKRAKWVLPWDGNCFVTPSAWHDISKDITSNPWMRYFVVPMARALSNQSLLENAEQPDPVEEPQIIMRKDATANFNEQFNYGRRPKVELFWALAIPGKWDRWKDDPWDQIRRELLPESNQFGVAGWVARLYSGAKQLELNSAKSFQDRGLARTEAILSTLRFLDSGMVLDKDKKKETVYFRDDVIRKCTDIYKHRSNSSLFDYVQKFVDDADIAMVRSGYAVTEKTTLPPSGDIHDYWHPAPYWWPDPDKDDGLPYIKKDGQRVPGTQMYEEGSEQYDRTRLQRVFDDSLSLALAFKITNNNQYADKAIEILKSFFLDPETRMNPHLEYAQVRKGHNKDRGTGRGIIEFKDFYYYLDAVRLLEMEGKVSQHDSRNFHAWLNEYLKWLQDSKQGKTELIMENNHGTYYDLQVASIAAYTGNIDILIETFARTQARISCQITPEGMQPKELERKTSAHYCYYNLQGLLHLAILAQSWGVDLWNFEAKNGASLPKAVDWLVQQNGKEWPYEQIDWFDYERHFPLLLATKQLNLDSNSNKDLNFISIKRKFFPHDGVLPYWNLNSIISMNRNRIKFLAAREDGLGSRLCAMVNAISLAIKFDQDFIFSWPEKKFNQEFHSIASVESIFSENFIAKHFLRAGFEKSNYINAMHDKFSCDKIDKIDVKKHGWLIGQEKITNFIDEQYNIDKAYLHEAFAYIDFNKNIKQIKNEIENLSMKKNSVAVHVRGGDIVYSDKRDKYQKYFVKKALPISVAKMMIEYAIKNDESVIVFYEDAIVKDLLSEYAEILFACDLIGVQNTDMATQAISEILLLRRCKKIYGSISGFTRVALWTSPVQLISPLAIYDRREIAKFIEGDLKKNSVLMDSFQIAFSWYSIYLLLRDQVDTEAANIYLSNAIEADCTNNLYTIEKITNYMRNDDIDLANRECSNIIEQNRIQNIYKFVQLLVYRHANKFIFKEELELIDLYEGDKPWLQIIKGLSVFFRGDNENGLKILSEVAKKINDDKVTNIIRNIKNK